MFSLYNNPLKVVVRTNIPHTVYIPTSCKNKEKNPDGFLLRMSKADFEMLARIPFMYYSNSISFLVVRMYGCVVFCL